MAVAAHDRVVQDDSHDRQALAHGRFDLHPDGAKRQVTHDVDDRLVRLSEFCSQRDAQASAELG